MNPRPIDQPTRAPENRGKPIPRRPPVSEGEAERIIADEEWRRDHEEPPEGWEP